MDKYLEIELEAPTSGKGVGGVEDVRVDGTSVVTDGIANINLTGKQDKLSTDNTLTLENDELKVNKEVIQEKLVEGENVTIEGNKISALKGQILVAKDSDIVDKDTLDSTQATYAIVIIYNDEGNLRFTWLRSDQGQSTVGSLYQYIDGYRVINKNYDWPQEGTWDEFMNWCDENSANVASLDDIPDVPSSRVLIVNKTEMMPKGVALGSLIKTYDTIIITTTASTGVTKYNTVIKLGGEYSAGSSAIQLLVNSYLTWGLVSLSGSYNSDANKSWGDLEYLIHLYKKKITTFDDIKIDSIALNGTVQTPDNKKQVNLTIDKSTVGLNNVDNTSDANKPVSTAQQNAIDAVQSNLDEEITRAQGAESTLQQNITKEENRAKGAEQSLQEAITAETNRADEMEKSIQTKLNTEIADRKSGDSTLTTNLDNEITRATNAENANKADIEAIQKVIPNQASETNQLADKAFVNSSVNAVAATFRGNFATKAALDAWQTANPGVAKKNDYAIVEQDETHSNQQWRYLYQTAWEAQYKVNDAPFTEAQNAAINSGATKAIIDSIANKLNKSDVLNASGSATDKPISQNAATQIAQNVQTNLEAHITDNENPHGVTKAQVGLGNVDNTSDKNKPVSTAQQTAIDAKLDKVTTTTTSRQAYVKNADGSQGMVDITITAADSSMMQRDASGRSYVNNAVQPKHIVNLQQMNDAIATAQPYHIEISGIGTNITLEQYNGLANDPNSYVVVGATGAQVTYHYSRAVDGSIYYHAGHIVGSNGKIELAEVILHKSGTGATFDYVNHYAQDIIYKVTDISENSTDNDYPSAKATYDADQATLTAAKSYADTAIANAITTALNTPV